jgi:hypothetical protein
MTHQEQKEKAQTMADLNATIEEYAEQDRRFKHRQKLRKAKLIDQGTQRP